MVTLKQLLALPEFATIQVVSGKEGVDRRVTGVNVMESDSLTAFFKQDELLVTTGISIHGDMERLFALVEAAYERKTAGMILNVGPYIPYIPQKVLQFSNTHAFPVFEMPWVYRVADFVKLTIQYLTKTSGEQQSIKNLMTQILLHNHWDETMAAPLARGHITCSTYYEVIVYDVNDAEDFTVFPSWMEFIIEQELKKAGHVLFSMAVKTRFIVLMEHSGVKLTEHKIRDVHQKILKNKKDKLQLFVGIGSAYLVTELNRSYHEALTVIELARNHRYFQIAKYAHTGVFKLLRENIDKQTLRAMHQQTLGPLYNYDRVNGTDLVSFLRIFIEEDGHATAIAQRTFVHRNTVLYKMKKIESILESDLTNPYEKNNLLMALMIEDILA